MKSPGHTKGTARKTRKPVHGEECVLVREVLNRVGDKWSVLAIAMLGDGTKRFNEMRRTIEGISQRMLTLTLRGLERDGIVERTVYPTVPPRVEYSLTPLGGTLLKTITDLSGWAARNGGEIHRARVRFDEREASEKIRFGLPR